MFGFADGDVLPDVDIGGQTVAGSALVVSRYTGLGLDVDGHVPWFERAADLLDRFGPFRLAHLEALVRFADWRASSDPSEKESIDA